MPSDLLAPENRRIGNPSYGDAAARPELLTFLKGKDNPFDVFVAARQPDAEFSRFHVPAVHREVHGALTAIIERYRSGKLQWESDLPRSGVVVVHGARGTGKTHMVHVLCREVEPPRVVVAPSIYEPHRPFIEYLLHQLVRHFQNEAEGQPRGTLELLADALARQVAVQALYGMTDIEWLARGVRGRWNLANMSFVRALLGWGARRLSDRKRLLIHDLEEGAIPSIREVCAQHEEDPEELRRLVREHIARVETAGTIAGQIRRGLYTRLADLAFGGPREAIYDFLLDGYTEVEVKVQPSRETLVDELFQALLELCLLARMPVVFAFDALETLLGDPPEPRLCHAFTKGLADVLDSHRGIPFLLFAEYGHWQKAQAQMSEYARQRFQQGVIRVPGHGSISILEIPRVSARQLGQIVAARMKPLLAEFFDSESPEAADTFPFQEEDLRGIARSEGDEPPLRQALQALRDRYEELVNGKPAGQDVPVLAAARPVSAGGGWAEQLESSWNQEQRAAKRRLAAENLGALADELHAGLVRWLEFIVAEGVSGPAGKPTSAANEILGNHPTYGQITRYEWSADGAAQPMGLGLLLGGGPGMRRDLETKLKMVAAKDRSIETLVVLWPKGRDVPLPVYESFPPGTREVWNQFEKRGVTGRVLLRAIDPDELVPWLALPRWLNTLLADAPDMPGDVPRRFIVRQSAAPLRLLAPEN